MLRLRLLFTRSIGRFRRCAHGCSLRCGFCARLTRCFGSLGAFFLARLSFGGLLRSRFGTRLLLGLAGLRSLQLGLGARLAFGVAACLELRLRLARGFFGLQARLDPRLARGAALGGLLTQFRAPGRFRAFGFCR